MTDLCPLLFLATGWTQKCPDHPIFAFWSSQLFFSNNNTSVQTLLWCT